MIHCGDIHDKREKGKKVPATGDIRKSSFRDR